MVHNSLFSANTSVLATSILPVGLCLIQKNSAGKCLIIEVMVLRKNGVASDMVVLTAVPTDKEIRRNIGRRHRQ